MIAPTLCIRGLDVPVDINHQFKKETKIKQQQFCFYTTQYLRKLCEKLCEKRERIHLAGDAKL